MFGVKDALPAPPFAEVGPIPHHINQGALGHAKRAGCVVHAHGGHKPSWGHYAPPFVAGGAGRSRQWVNMPPPRLP